MHYLILFCWLLHPMVSLHAQPGLDPTRPPSLPSAGEGSSGTFAQSSTGLQTVIIPKKGKPSAVIDGQQVFVGQQIGDSRVLRISETEVVLKGAAGNETLKMFPDINKKPATISGVSKPRRSKDEFGDVQPRKIN